MTSRSRLVIALGIAFLWTPRADAQELFRPPLDAKVIAATSGSEWFGLYIKGKKIGYYNSTRGKVDGKIRDGFHMNMKLTSFGKKTELTLSQFQLFANEAPYRLLSGEFKQNDGDTNQTIVYQAKGKGYEVTLNTNGEIRKRQVNDLDYTLADAMASEVWIRSGPELGSKIRAQDLDPQEMRLDEQKLKLVSIKNSLVGGVMVRYYEVDSVSKRSGISALSRYDDQGRLLSGVFAGLFELRRETEEQAKNTEYSQDLFVMGTAKIDQPLGYTPKIKSLIVEADAKETEGFEDGPRQSITPEEKGKRLIKLGKGHGKSIKATAKEIEEALQETNAYAINDPKVKAMAAEAVGDAKTPEMKVKNIVAFVHRFVRPTLTVNMPNIHDLMKKKQGDCKSYALLTTTLCRAAGVPSREVSGLLYMGDDQKAFGGHAWNEVVLQGVWVPVDASLGQTEVDAGHICFGADHKASKNLLTTLGKLSFRLVEVDKAN